MGFLSKLLKTGLVIGAGITALQANEKTRSENAGEFNTGSFVRNFKQFAAVNVRYLADVIKGKLGGKAGEYRYSDKGENGYAYKDAEPAGDKLSEVFETMKEKAPEVIGKVQDFVEDVRENAPEYREKAKDFVEDVKEAAKKALDKEDE